MFRSQKHKKNSQATSVFLCSWDLRKQKLLKKTLVKSTPDLEVNHTQILRQKGQLKSSGTKMLMKWFLMENYFSLICRHSTKLKIERSTKDDFRQQKKKCFIIFYFFYNGNVVVLEDAFTHPPCQKLMQKDSFTLLFWIICK